MDIKVQRDVAIIPPNELEVVVELKTPINLEKSVILVGGSICNSNSHRSHYWDARLELVDGKHIIVKRAYTSLSPAEVSWQVLEFVKE